MMKKECLECNRSFQGRTDAKFCSSSCRSAYNNRTNSNTSAEIRRVNAILKKNLKILSRFNKQETTRVKREDLQRAGFDFMYLTNIYVTSKGKNYKFCYEQGYIDDDGAYITLVRKKDYVR